MSPLSVFLRIRHFLVNVLQEDTLCSVVFLNVKRPDPNVVLISLHEPQTGPRCSPLLIRQPYNPIRVLIFPGQPSIMNRN